MKNPAPPASAVLLAGSRAPRATSASLAVAPYSPCSEESGYRSSRLCSPQENRPGAARSRALRRLPPATRRRLPASLTSPLLFAGLVSEEAAFAQAPLGPVGHVRMTSAGLKCSRSATFAPSQFGSSKRLLGHPRPLVPGPHTGLATCSRAHARAPGVALLQHPIEVGAEVRHRRKACRKKLLQPPPLPPPKKKKTVAYAVRRTPALKPVSCLPLGISASSPRREVCFP